MDARPVTVIVLASGARESVRPALDRVARTAPHARCLVAPLPGPGATAAWNRALDEAGENDVVFLQRDAEVFEGWLESLAEGASVPANVATVTPLTDRDGCLPPLRSPLPPARTARLVARLSRRQRPFTPIGDSRCLYVTRRALDFVGPLDARDFPDGAGALEDLCLRATAVGLVHRLDEGVFVRFAGRTARDPSRAALEARARERLQALHPRAARRLEDLAANDPLGRLRPGLEAALRRASEVPDSPGRAAGSSRPSLLHIVRDRAPGGAADALALAGDSRGEWHSWILEVGAARWSLVRVEPDGGGAAPGIRAIHQVRFARPWRFDLPLDEDRTDALREICAVHDIAVAHLHHPFGTGPEAIHLLDDLGVPVVVSFADFAFLCPSARLVDESGRFCAGICRDTAPEAPGTAPPRGLRGLFRATRLRRADCQPEHAMSGRRPRLKHAYAHLWRARCAASLDRCAVFLAPTVAARRLLESHFEFPGDRPFRVLRVVTTGRREANGSAPFPLPEILASYDDAMQLPRRGAAEWPRVPATHTTHP